MILLHALPASLPPTAPSSAPAPADGRDGGPDVLVPATHAPGDEGATATLSASRIAAGWVLLLSCAAVLAAAWQVGSGQREHGYFLLSLCFVVCFAATWVDIATRRIPNVLTYTAILLGLALNGLLPLLLERLDQRAALVWLGSSGALDCIQGFGLCAAIGISSFLVRGLGGGDVKLLAAVGALIGFQAVVVVLFNTLLVAAVLGVANWTLGGQLMRRLQALAGAVYFSVVLRSNLRTLYGFKATEGPFALSLLLGLVLAQFVALHRLLLSVGW